MSRLIMNPGRGPARAMKAPMGGGPWVAMLLVALVLGTFASPALAHRQNRDARRSAHAGTLSKPPSTLPTGGLLRPGRALRSPNGRYTAVMKRDGNLVVYGPTRLDWQSKTAVPGTAAVMQRDGNLVLRAPGGQALWSSATAPSERDKLVMQDDGNLVIYTGDGRALWSIATGLLANGTKLSAGWFLAPGQALHSSDGRYTAIMQTDGNFVVYAPDGHATWNSGTEGHPGARVTMQSDGNLVVYSAQGQALWSSATNPSQGDTLVMQTDGNLVIYNGGGTALWSIGTGLIRSVYAPWTPNWNYAGGFYDEWDYSDGASDEYGIDVPLNAGTPIYAPEAGHIFWQSAAQAGGWSPGRLVEVLNSGAVVAFGHVLPYGQWPRSVAGGQQIATVGDNGSNSHVEFMYDASGNGGPSYYNRSYFLPASAVASSNGCPNRSWSGGGAGVDPCAVLIHYMHGNTP